jgi:hypothetical protein
MDTQTEANARAAELLRLTAPGYIDQVLTPSFPNSQSFDMVPALVAWAGLQKWAAFFKEAEMRVRKAVFVQCFPAPKLGVNSFPLNQGYVLKATHKINYALDEALIPLVRAELASQNIPLDPFLKVSYKLVESAYKEITADEQKNQTIGPVLRKMITATDAAPAMEITLPAAAKKAQERADAAASIQLMSPHAGDPGYHKG